MKCTINGSDKVAFCGMSVRAPRRIISNAEDAIAQWNILKHPQYTNIFQETERVSEEVFQENCRIREDNYRFLDELVSDIEKSKFIEYFKKLTGFPDLRECAAKMLEEFKRVLHLAAKKEDSRVLLSGYDRFCSLGLERALPGSDIDKGFAIVKGNPSTSLLSQIRVADEIKGHIWENIDNRIFSVNHCAAFPNVVTDFEVNSRLDIFDEKARIFINDENFDSYRWVRMTNPYTISGSKFNISLSQFLPTKEEKTDAKNFAYVIETIRDGKLIPSDNAYTDFLFSRMHNSPFSWLSNITQGYPLKQRYEAGNVVKNKLRAREEMQESFNSWGISQQYELVKDIIRGMSGDNRNPHFRDLFAAPTDRHRLLINDILCGNVYCRIRNPETNSEAVQLVFPTYEMEAKYGDLNAYN